MEKEKTKKSHNNKTGRLYLNQKIKPDVWRQKERIQKQETHCWFSFSVLSRSHLEWAGGQDGSFEERKRGFKPAPNSS